jgi:hypothetical protein
MLVGGNGFGANDDGMKLVGVTMGGTMFPIGNRSRRPNLASSMVSDAAIGFSRHRVQGSRND